MLKRYGEINGVVFRNHGYDPYHMATKYKLSYNGGVFWVYALSFKELKTEIAKLTGGL